MEKYDHQKIEKKWRRKWAADGIYATAEDASKPKAFVLDMFPYPSGEGLHVGHPKGYIATDIYSRHKRMTGHSVLHPMGWDAFGLPAENYAIQTKTNPAIAVARNIRHYKEQLESLGFDYDWSREINTTDPAYYKWTQWIFLKLFEKGLAYQSDEPINWCPSCMTGLSNEDLDDGRCERCGSVVEKKKLRQWVLKITDYAERLLGDLELLPKWPEHIKESQRNWIGKSEGAEISFQLSGDRFQGKEIKIFTTRPDTLFGATYLVLAPEHPLAQTLAEQSSNKDELYRYIGRVMKKSEIERMAEGKEKTGVQLKDVWAVNPANKEEVPVFIADYVLGYYGTGAIMAVPAHDYRDYAFAKAKNVSVKPVLHSYVEFWDETTQQQGEIRKGSTLTRKTFTQNAPEIKVEDEKLLDALKAQATIDLERGHIFTRPGILFDSGEFSGMYSDYAKAKITEFVGGKMVTTYKLRDWVFSRQRYWGEPIPIIHCVKCGAVPVPEKDLPVVLPEVEHYEPSGTGESPLANIAEWVNVPCPKCGGSGRRETNTMPQWAGSSWYYLRYMDAQNDTALVDSKKEKYWAPVDMYVGGAEHATRHLIYARFWHKFLADLGIVSTQEPFDALYSVGLIIAEDGRKMSKRFGNVINPDEIVREHGADTLRVYEMFMGPFENAIAWSTQSLIGSRRFLERVWKLAQEPLEQENPALDALLHKTIKKVEEDIAAFKFNTAVSQMMIFLNAAEKGEGAGRKQWGAFLRLLAPFAPHMAEELWMLLGNTFSVHQAAWPKFDPALMVEDSVTLAVQINGKLRATTTLTADAGAKEMEQAARSALGERLEGARVVKVITVPGRLVNFVVENPA